MGGTSQYIIIDITFTMTNPSNITITVGDINFDVVMNEFNAVVGRVYVKDAVIPPGGKTYSAEMHLGEKSTNAKAVSQMLGDYLTSAKIPLTIQGSPESTKIAPLGPALNSVKLATEMTGIAGNLISQIAVKGSIIGLLILNKGSAQITLKNPLNSPFSIKTVHASVVFKPSSGAAPFTVGTIDYDLPSPATVPAKGQMTTDDWPVKIVGSGIEHLGQMLGLLLDPAKYFDVQQNVTVSVGNSNGGYDTQMFYYQDRVPFTISIDGLPPIGITASSLSKMSLPSNITSVTDPNQLEQMIKDILSGKTPTSSVIASTANATSTATDSSSASKTSDTATQVTVTTTKATDDSKATESAKDTSTTEAKATPTEDSKKSDTATTEAAETTTRKPLFSLPF